ncbi:uncharacterized protein LOC131939351 [Physella acuta]|uniref:uncharacterized protein LOC131939351 n=1 Tax=Physella acuta TaxID=109671 RepID=UPI0027DB9A8A|nr:uncharacterized protein LOC131939351 [Physella acuta]
MSLARHQSKSLPGGYLPAGHSSYKLLSRSISECERFFTTGSIVSENDMHKPEILVNLIRAEKIKDITERVTKPTMVSNKTPRLASQETLMAEQNYNVKKLLFDDVGGNRKVSSRSGLLGPGYANILSGQLPPPTGCAHVMYHKLWRHSSPVSYQQRWSSNQKHLHYNFLPRVPQESKTYSLHRCDRHYIR